MERCEIILDTNIALHFQPIDQIDWAEISGAKCPIVVITPVLLAELERQKIFNPSSVLKKRAQRSIDDIERLMALSDPVELRPNVTLRFVENEPLLDYATYRLARDVHDDQFIAAALERHALTRQPTFIASNDSGMALKLRSRPVSILKLPPSLRLPEEEDAHQKELKQAKLEAQRLRNRQPRLTIRFAEAEGEKRKLKISNPRTIDLGIPSLADMKAKYRSIPVAGASFASSSRPSAPKLKGFPGFTAEDRAKVHNDRLAAYFERYKLYLDELEGWTEALRLSSDLKLEMFNGGSGTATDVDVTLRFPPSVKLMLYTDFPKRPEAPTLPNSLYKNNVEDLISRSWLNLPHLQGINDGDASIYEDEVGTVRFSCRLLKPKCTLRLQTFILVQQSPLDGKGIEVDVRITLHDGEPVNEKLAITFVPGEAIVAEWKDDDDEAE